MKVVELSGGVGGARMAVGLARLSTVDLTVVVNVGDDEEIHGLHVSPDIDTVTYTLAGTQGPEGWGRTDDTFKVNTELARFGLDNTFILGDLDLALNLFRTNRLATGATLSTVTDEVRSSFKIASTLLPASDNRLRTEVMIAEENWISFQEYFVIRQNRDLVMDIRFSGAGSAAAAPGVVESIQQADHVVIAPSNPPLSIWPILAIEEIRSAVVSHSNVTAVSPLIGGKTLKGPADRVMASLGLPNGNAGVAKAYEHLVNRLMIDSVDRIDVDKIESVEAVSTDIRIKEPEDAERLAREIVGL